MLAVNATLTEVEIDEKEKMFTEFVRDNLGNKPTWMVTPEMARQLLEEARVILNGDTEAFRRWYAAREGFSVQVQEILNPLYFVVEQAGEAPPPLPEEVEVAIVVNRSVLLRTLNKVIGATMVSQSMTVLGHVFFDLDGDRLTLRATNLTVTASASCQVVCGRGPGGGALPARLLLDWLSATKGEYVVLGIGEEVRSLRSSYVPVRLLSSFEDGRPVVRSVMRGKPLDAWPGQMDDLTGQTVTLPARQIYTLLRRVAHYISDEEDRVLSGVYLSLQNGDLQVVAANGFGLAVSGAGMETDDVSCIIHRSALKMLSDNLKVSDQVAITISDKMAKFEFGGTTVVGYLKEGAFPDYSKIMPKTHTWQALINRKKLIGDLNRAIVVQPVNNGVELYLEPGRLTVMSSSVEFGDYSSAFSIETDGLTGVHGVKVGKRLLASALQALDGDEVVIERDATAVNSPLLVYSADEVEGEARTKQLLMPWRTDSWQMRL
ncbi:MAG: hypothetical protein FOGNACKC_00737 [Anaerolineae bacterium]|nr:hypothetical protein [Anaerolineae bacterium]